MCHECDNRPCVRDAHLFLGTPKINLEDMDVKGRRVVWHPNGESNPASKISDEQRSVVIQRVLSGESSASVADAFQITAERVNQILRKEGYSAKRISGVRGYKYAWTRASALAEGIF